MTEPHCLPMVSQARCEGPPWAGAHAAGWQFHARLHPVSEQRWRVLFALFTDERKRISCAIFYSGVNDKRWRLLVSVMRTFCVWQLFGVIVV